MKFTRHAEIRRQQRGFPPFITDTILQFGEVRSAAGEATRVFLGNRQHREIVGELKRAIQQRYRARLPKVDVKAALRHIDHIAKVAGPDHVGIGSDFDGISGMVPAGLEDVSKFPALIRGMIDLGYSDDDIRKIAGGNLLRVMRANE